jgi:hypothetical protein
MQAVDLDLGPPVDPDEITVPESPEHRRVVELIAAMSSLHLPAGVVCHRNMNWYPLDGGNAIAPDVMTLPVGTVVRPQRSYRQHVGGPLPGAVVEVPSASDSFDGFREKLYRFHRLGVPAFVVTADGPFAVLRLGLEDRYELPWAGKAIAELGGITIDGDDDGVFVQTPDGRIVRRAEDLTIDALRRADMSAAQAAASAAQAAASAAQAAASAAEASAARNRVAQLEARLRSLGSEI